MPNSKSPLMMKVVQGAVAGLVASLPMTLFMRSFWKRLPAEEQYALPPRQITRQVVSPRRFRSMSAGSQSVLTLLFHFLFGAGAGAVYGLVEEKVPLHRSVKGSRAGMAVWSGSYLGWIPALGILPLATEHPWRRNVMMIAAHLVWGLALGALAGVTSSKKTYITIR